MPAGPPTRDSVDPSFAALFEGMDEDARAVLGEAAGASWAPLRPAQAAAARAPAPADAEQVRAATKDSLRALMLIRAYRVRGHLEAKLDPLGLQVPHAHAELDPRSYGFADSDLDRPIFIDNVLGLETATIRQIVHVVRESYCGPVGVELKRAKPAQHDANERANQGAIPLGQGRQAATISRRCVEKFIERTMPAQDALDHAGRDAPDRKAGNVSVGRSCSQGHSYSYPARGHVSARQSPCSICTATPSRAAMPTEPPPPQRPALTPAASPCAR